MSEIVLGFATSHGPLIGTPPDVWLIAPPKSLDAKFYTYRNQRYSYNEMLALRRDEKLARLCTEQVKAERHERVQKSMDALAAILDDIKPDVVVMTGDDQREWFAADRQPTFAVAACKEIINIALDAPKIKELRPWRHIPAELIYKDKVDISYEVETDLAQHIVQQSREDGFDIMVCNEQPSSSEGKILGHAFGFIMRRILADRNVPIVPFPINAMYSPNTPTPRRCYEFGAMLGRSIQSWKSDKKVAICGSGGMSHFICDEDWDKRLMDEVATNDVNGLCGENDANFGSGNAEVKNWIIAAGAMAQTTRKVAYRAYTPCYTLEAGVGQGMGVMTWQ